MTAQRLMLTCHITGREFDSGISADGGVQIDELSVRCHHCGQQHEFSVSGVTAPPTAPPSTFNRCSAIGGALASTATATIGDVFITSAGSAGCRSRGVGWRAWARKWWSSISKRNA